MNERIICQAEEVGAAYVGDQLRRAVQEVIELECEDLELRGITLVVENANQWIDFVAGDDKELYNKYVFEIRLENGKYKVTNRR